ncbi:sodium:solute symporter family protein [Porticoccus sp. GXU_MW_L64]
MAFLDWVIVGLYVAFAIGIGMYFTKKASESTTDFFVAGRSLPWYIAGTSMVATTFSADTPLFVSGLVREEGIYANWIWWTTIIGILVSVFFFASLWRRSKVLTEIELISLRYDSGPAASFLRVFKALLDGVFINCIIIASVTLAMSKIVVVILGLSSDPLFTLPLFGDVTSGTLILLLLAISAVAYTALSGLYGVVYTDLIQFVLAIVGAIALAVIVYLDLDDKGGVMTALQAAPGFTENTLRMFPEFEWNLETATFLILVTIGWLNYAPGFGFFLQRTLAARTEKDAVLGLYWFAFCHLILRSWPWIIVGVASLVYFPNLVDGEQAYPQMIDSFLPIGLKGVMVAALLAAFMSTLDTHLNWGSSYLVNDIYQPFIAKGRSKEHYVKVARISMLLLSLVALIVTTQLTSIVSAYEYIGVIIIPVSVVLIARWYWWRINVWSEIAALLTAAIVGNALAVLMPDSDGERWFAVRWLYTTLATLGVCLVVTLVTSRNGPTKQATAFYERLRIHGKGWQRVREQSGVTPVSVGLKDNTIACIASIVLIYSLLFAIGYALFDQWANAGWFLLASVVSGYIVVKKIPTVIRKLREDVS